MKEIHIILLGTIHGQHLTFPAYGFCHLQAAFFQARADFLLVEIRPGPFRVGNLADGPIEMSYLVELARAHVTPAAGIDWFRDELLFKEPDVDLFQQLDTELRQLTRPPGHNWPLDYQQCHCEPHLRYLQAVHHTRIRLLGDEQEGDWMRRTFWMTRHIMQALQNNAPHRVLLAVGVEHVADLMDQLSMQKNINCSLSAPLESITTNDCLFPQTIFGTWQQGVEYLHARMSMLQPNTSLYMKLQNKAASWQQAIAQHGLTHLSN